MDKPKLEEKLLHILTNNGYQSPLPYINTLIQQISEKVLTVEEFEERLNSNEPIQYILGSEVFLGRDFTVNKSVLIPRVETEVLVNYAIDIISTHNITTYDLYDIGTGSGIIGISMILDAPNKPEHSYLVDISKDALEVCKVNHQRLAKNHKVELTKASLLDFNTAVGSSKHAVICANLPYVESNDLKQLEDSVIMHEPHVALDGGKNGMELIDKLLEQVNLHDRYEEFSIFLEGDELFEQKITESLKTIITKKKVNRLSIFADQFGVYRFAYIRLNSTTSQEF